MLEWTNSYYMVSINTSEWITLTFEARWDKSIPLFLHVAIYLEVSLFRWTSQNAFSRETAMYKWYCVQCWIAALHTLQSHRLYDKVSSSQVLQIHTQTDGNDIRPHTAQIYNEVTSTDLNLVTASSTVHEPAEDGLKNGPKYVGANFKCFLSVLMWI